MSGTIHLLGPCAPPYGGAATFTGTLHALLLNNRNNCRIHGYGHIPNAMSPTFSGIWRRFRKLTSYDRCLDSTTFFLEYPHAGALLAWLGLKRALGFRWIKVVHDSTLPERYPSFSWRERWCFQQTLRHADRIVTVSSTLADFLAKWLPPNRRPLVLNSLLPWSHLQQGQPLPQETAQFMGQFEQVVCTMGAWATDYGFHLVADAVESLRQQTNRNIGLIAIDGGFTHDSALRARVLAGDRPWLHALSALPHTQVLAILSHCQLFVRAVRQESFGLSRVEALWCGTPVVASNVGETRGMRCVPFEDAAALKAAMQETLTHPPMDAVQAWAKRFHEEAHHNLSQWILLLQGEAP